MKKLLIITMLFSVSFATPKKNLKQDLTDCEIALQKALNSPDLVNNEQIPSKLNKNGYKAIKQAEKTKRTKILADKHEVIKELETIKAVTKIEEKQETNRNFIVNTRRLISQNSWVFALVFIVGALLGTPFGAVLKSFFKK